MHEKRIKYYLENDSKKYNFELVNIYIFIKFFIFHLIKEQSKNSQFDF